jgi:hypothetical protein
LAKVFTKCLFIINDWLSRAHSLDIAGYKPNFIVVEKRTCGKVSQLLTGVTKIMTFVGRQKFAVSALFAAVFLLVAAGAAQAFQVYTPDQLANGIGVRGGAGFTDTTSDLGAESKTHFSISSGSSNNSSPFSGNSAGYSNWYGRQDTAGRSYTDDQNSGYQNCAPATNSQVGMLNAFGSGHNGSYPCQRFR